MSNLSKELQRQKRIDISADMTEEFYKQARKGQVLKFKQEDGVVLSYKIIRLNRKSKKCEVIPVALYTEDQVNVVDKDDDNA